MPVAYDAFKQAIHTGTRHVIADIREFLHPHETHSSNFFSLHTEQRDWRWSEDHLRRMFTIIRREHRPFALVLAWDLIADHVLARCDANGVEQQTLHDRLDGIRNLLQAPITRHTPTATVCARALSGALEDLGELRAWYGPNLPQRSEPCVLLEKWWRCVTSRLAIANAAEPKRWPPPFTLKTLDNYLVRVRFNTRAASRSGSTAPLNWVDLTVWRQIAKRTLRVLEEQRRPSINPFACWAIEHTRLLQQLDPHKPDAAAVESAREHVYRVPDLLNRDFREHSTWVQFLDASPVRLAAACDAAYWSLPHFTRDGSGRFVAEHEGRAVFAMLWAMVPIGRRYPWKAARYDWLIDGHGVKWTNEPRWKAITHSWWRDTWRAWTSYDNSIAVG